MLKKGEIKIKNLPVEIYYSSFSTPQMEEYHFSFTLKKYSDFKKQLQWLKTAYENTLKLLNLKEETSVFRRFFCSDLYNQISYLKKEKFSNPNNYENPTAISLINQTPFPPAKISLWAYHIKLPKNKIEKEKKKNNLFIKIGDLIHNWTTGLIFTEKDSIYDQTKKVIENYIEFLKENDMKISDNVIRTWFFIQNIDTDYSEFVKARKEIYEKNGLTKDTHYIASTGVGGFYYDLKAKVLLDAYSISGIKRDQIKFLSAPKYLSPTYIYGVTFERGVLINYSDRKHIIISGTASINNKGEIVYPENINLQIERTITNISALLKKGGGSLEDVMIFVVYIRDLIDYVFVEKKLREKFKKTPIIFAIAPVCRPGWLVEIECWAVIS